MDPPFGLLRYVRVEVADGRRVALDDRPPLADRVGQGPIDFGPTKYDDAGWHEDGAMTADQPVEHAFTHIGLYLTWLIRHDLIEHGLIPRRDVDAIRNGSMVDRRLMDDIDGKLVSDLMTLDGAAFSDERYDAYLEAYGRVFADEPDYGAASDEAAFNWVAPAIDQLWREWRTGRGVDRTASPKE